MDTIHEDGPIGCLETSVLKQPTLRNNPEDGRIQVNCSGNLQFRLLLTSTSPFYTAIWLATCNEGKSKVNSHIKINVILCVCVCVCVYIHIYLQKCDKLAVKKFIRVSYLAYSVQLVVTFFRRECNSLFAYISLATFTASRTKEDDCSGRAV